VSAILAFPESTGAVVVSGLLGVVVSGLLGVVVSGLLGVVVSDLLAVVSAALLASVSATALLVSTRAELSAGSRRPVSLAAGPTAESDREAGAYAFTAVSAGGGVRRATVIGCFRLGVVGLGLGDSVRVVCCSMGDTGWSFRAAVVVEVSRTRLVSGRVRSEV
jgi:hypothetical protein